MTNYYRTRVTRQRRAFEFILVSRQAFIRIHTKIIKKGYAEQLEKMTTQFDNIYHERSQQVGSE